MPARYVLDTNIITALLRGDVSVVQNIAIAARENAELYLCPVVFYEIRRGLLYRDARNQSQLFLQYAATLIWDDFNHSDWLYAAELWSDLRQRGITVGDADLLIGVYAFHRYAVVVTANEKHFAPLGVAVENWL